jgi:alginate O-acetyltransferase complex protein AlgI
MLFTSPVFLFAFLPLTLAGYLIALRLGRPRLVTPWLLAASMMFYAWWSPVFLALLVASTLVNWLCARAIETRGKGEPGRKAIFIAGLVWNLGLLAVFKYADFFIDTVDRLSGADWPLLHIILPLGISFFTFQKIAYLADIHAGHATSGRLMDFALFVFFFPQLIAGPIVHHAEIMPQFRKIAAGHREGALAEHLAVGLTLFVIGLFKKIVIADQVAPFSTSVFEMAAAGKPIGLALGWQAALAYTVQLYFDFSGYSDMAIGLARMFGVRMPANFDSPYRAASIVDFWRRWHMTLSRFLRDYLYVPLGGNRSGPAARYRNLMIVMLLGGLWHGAGWTYVVWGGLHGLYLMIAHLWRDRVGLRLPAVLGWALTMLAVILAWVFFRAPDMASALNVLAGMTGRQGGASLAEGQGQALVAIGALLVAAAVLPNSQQILRAFRPVLDGVAEPAGVLARIRWRPTAAFGALVAAVFLTALMYSWKSSEFLYFQF